MNRNLVAMLLLLSLLCACSDGGPTTGLYTGDGGLSADVGQSDGDLGGEPDGVEPPDGGGPEGGGPPPCVEGATTCINGKLALCDPQFGWLLEACPKGLLCIEGDCVASACKPLSARCFEGGVQICAPDGLGWSNVMPCPRDQVCLEGACVPAGCLPGESQCAGDKLLVCDEDGLGWIVEECEEGQLCQDGGCIDCAKDSDCPAGQSCTDGVCLALPLEIVTAALPDGKLDEPYELELIAQGGTEPYEWTVSSGKLPQGIELGSDGVVAGKPEEAGEFELTLEVEDAAGESADKSFTFTIFGPPTGLIITTGSPLPGGTEGEPYSVKLAASGGVEPYFFGISSGALPAGLTLGSDGLIHGTPADHGTFTFQVKVFDNGEPVGMGNKEFQLTVKIAPLEIVGGQVYDLWVTKIIVLPLITTIDLIPIPYSAQLEAKGGVKPYKWSEQPLPSFVGFLIPNGGLPTGLTLESDGKLHGSSTDTSKVVKVSIPFTGIDLSGYFFTAKVEDSQSPPDSAWAIYLIPTVPIAW